MYKTLSYAVTDPAATTTLNRPDRLNAITGQTRSTRRCGSRSRRFARVTIP